MKLNYKKTMFVGLAFFLISLFWQAYDSIIPKILTDKFGMPHFWSGVIMAIDNILALFLLPLFGTLSDKTKTKRGRRTPFIIVGTVIAATALIGLSCIDRVQLEKIDEIAAVVMLLYVMVMMQVTISISTGDGVDLAMVIIR